MHDNIFIVLLCLSFLLVSVLISTHYKKVVGTSHWHNWFHYRNALMMLIFMAFGHCLKKYPSKMGTLLPYGTVIYLLLFLFSVILGYHIPNSGHGTALSFKEIPLHLFCATIGTLMVLYISKKLFISKGNSVLEIFGRNSLAIYTVHYIIIETLIFALGKIWQPVDQLDVFLYYFIIVAIAMPCFYYIAPLFKKKPLNYLLGVF